MYSEQEYRSYPAINASGINLFRKTPAHYWQESPFNPDRIIKEKTPNLVFGSLAHCLILQPEAFEKEFIVQPAIDRRTKTGKEEFAEFELKAAGKTIITEDQLEKAMMMKNHLLDNYAAKTLLSEGISEKVVIWQKEIGGVPCKAKLDKIRNGLLIDYKTTSDITEDSLSLSIAKFGYHRQMAWYMEAAEIELGTRPEAAILIFQDKEFPQMISVRNLSGDALAQGKKECDEAYSGICERLKSGNWDAYPQKIEEINLPAWYFKKHQEDIENEFN